MSIIALAIGSVISIWAWVSWARVERSMRERQALKHSPVLFLLSVTVLAIAVFAAIVLI